MTVMQAVDPDLDEVYKTPEEVALRFGTTTGHLAQMRYMGTGPKFIKIGRFIRYSEASLNAYIAANTHTTSGAA